MTEKLGNLDNIRELPRAAVQATWESIAECRKNLWGSGEFLVELGEIKEAAVDLPADFLGGGLKSLAELVTLHPIDATMTAFKTVTEATKDMAQLIVSPVPTSLAIARGTIGKVGAIAKAPFAGAFKGFSVVGKGVENAYKWFTSTPTPAANSKPSGSQNGAFSSLTKNSAPSDSGSASSGSASAPAAA